jgi:hypothetical protein
LGVALDEGQQLGRQDRVVHPVVDPSPAERPVLHGAEQRGFGSGQRRGARPVRHEHELDTDLAGRVVQPESTRPAEGGLGPGDVPRLVGKPAGEQVEFARHRCRLVNLRHVPPLSPLRLPKPPVTGGGQQFDGIRCV